jgi:hypothetical protein
MFRSGEVEGSKTRAPMQARQRTTKQKKTDIVEWTGDEGAERGAFLYPAGKPVWSPQHESFYVGAAI